jgi:large subunit ribosomal protein L1
MGKVRKVVMGDVELEKKQRKKAEVRREAKKFKKEKIEKVGLKGGERTAVVEGTELKAEVREILEEVEKGGKPSSTPSTSLRTKAGRGKKRIGPKPRSKKYQEMAKLVDKTKVYPLAVAIDLVKKTSYTKFDGTVELHLNLNSNNLGEKKDFKGSVSLPHGTGKQVRVVAADDAILKDIEAGKINFDILVSHPSLMPKLAKVARILGPKGLMPNPKTGTVTEDVEKRVKELSHGQVNFKTEPENPIIHLIVGKVSFDDKKLMENVNAILDAVGRNKILKATLTATMGPGVRVMI